MRFASGPYSLRQGLSRRARRRVGPAGQTRPVLATTVSRIDVLAAAPERFDEYGCQRAFAPAQAGEPSTFCILAIDGGAVAQGRAPGRGPAEVGRPSAPAARRAGPEERSRSGRAGKRSKSCAAAESPACRSPIGISRPECRGAHRDREDRATASARRDGHRLERTAGAPGVPRLPKPLTQGPLREMVKESVPDLNTRIPGHLPIAFWHAGPPSIFRERRVHDFQATVCSSFNRRPDAAGAHPGCAAETAGSAAAASRRDGHRAGNLHAATTFCHRCPRLFLAPCRVVKPRPEGQCESADFTSHEAAPARAGGMAAPLLVAIGAHTAFGAEPPVAPRGEIDPQLVQQLRLFKRSSGPSTVNSAPPSMPPAASLNTWKKIGRAMPRPRCCSCGCFD